MENSVHILLFAYHTATQTRKHRPKEKRECSLFMLFLIYSVYIFLQIGLVWVVYVVWVSKFFEHPSLPVPCFSGYTVFFVKDFGQRAFQKFPHIILGYVNRFLLDCIG